MCSHQFCAKIIAYYHNAPEELTRNNYIKRKIARKAYGNTFGGIIFKTQLEKLKKIGIFFSSFNPFPSFSSVTTDDIVNSVNAVISFGNKTTPFCLGLH